MSLLYAVALLGVTAVLLRVLFIGSRLPRTAWWAGEGLGHFVIVAATGLITLGFIFLVEFLFTLKDQALGFKTILATGAIAAAYAITWKWLDRWSPTPPTLSVVPPSIPTGNGPSTIPPERPQKAA